MEDGPDLLGCHRDVDVADTQVPQRVDDGVRDGGRGADRRRLPYALGAQRVVRGRRDRLRDLPGRSLHRGRDEVVHECTGQVVTKLVVGDLLVERGREAHRQPTVDLAIDDHRVDDIAAVVDGNEPADVPADKTNRSLSCQFGSLGLYFRKRSQSAYAILAAPNGNPG